MPPLAPKHTSSKSYLKVENVRNEELIEEDITPENHNTTILETDADLYQVPMTGGVPIKIGLESRPFTPPFAQLVKMHSEERSKASQ